MGVVNILETTVSVTQSDSIAPQTEDNTTKQLVQSTFNIKFNQMWHAQWNQFHQLT